MTRNVITLLDIVYVGWWWSCLPPENLNIHLRIKLCSLQLKKNFDIMKKIQTSLRAREVARPVSVLAHQPHTVWRGLNTSRNPPLSHLKATPMKRALTLLGWSRQTCILTPLWRTAESPWRRRQSEGRRGRAHGTETDHNEGRRQTASVSLACGSSSYRPRVDVFLLLAFLLRVQNLDRKAGNNKLVCVGAEMLLVPVVGCF